jgi:hypothetical protein
MGPGRARQKPLFVISIPQRYNRGVNSKQLALLIAVVMALGILAAWLSLRRGLETMAERARTASQPVETAPGTHPGRGVTGDAARDAATPDDRSPRRESPGAGMLQIRLRIRGVDGAAVRDAIVSAAGTRPVSILQEGDLVVVEGDAPLEARVMADGYFGSVPVRVEQTAAGAVDVVLHRKKTVNYSISSAHGAVERGGMGLLAIALGDCVHYQFTGALSGTVDVPDAVGDCGWTNGYYQSVLRGADFRSGRDLEFKAEPAPTGTVRVRAAAKPTIQFALELPGFERHQFAGAFGSTTAVERNGFWLFDPVPAGTVRVFSGDSGRAGESEYRDEVVAPGATVEVAFSN